MKNRQSLKDKLLFVFLFTILILSLSIGAKNVYSSQKGFLWKVQTNNSVLYIAGSIHMYKSELFPLPQKMEEAFEKSDILAVEANINEIKPESITTIIDRTFYQDGTTLENHLSKEIYKTTVKKLNEIGLPPELFINTKPWFIALTITSIELQKLGLDPEYGIDRYFLKKAENRKKIVELESIDYQINLLNNFSDSEQELFLESTFRELELLKKEIDGVLKAWNTGDTKSFESFVSKSLYNEPKMKSIYEKIVCERNKNIALKIESYLKTKERYFIVIGAAHLVGKDGIIEILKKKGYIVEQL
jgi:uncharacterized protein YbaP (TraB family)